MAHKFEDEPEDPLDDELFRRLVLANQYEMLAGLYPDEAEGYRDDARQLRDWWPLDELGAISWMSEMRRDPLTIEDKRFVRDVLDMFDTIQRADEAGHVAEPDRGSIAFMGFCGNEEGRYLGYLRWLREHEVFAHVKLANPADINSHWPMTATYQRMLAKWRELGAPRTVDAPAVAAILAERVHPENRLLAETGAR